MSRVIVTTMPLSFSTDTPAPKRAGLVFSTEVPPVRSPPPARSPHQSTPPRPAAAKKKKNNHRGRDKGDTQDVVAARQLLDTRLSTLAGAVSLAQSGCRCGTCEHRLQQAYGDPDLPIEVRDSVARHAMDIRRAFWPVGVTARAQKRSRVEAMQSVKMYSSRTQSVLLQGCLFGDLRVMLCEGEPPLLSHSSPDQSPHPPHQPPHGRRSQFHGTDDSPNIKLPAFLTEVHTRQSPAARRPPGQAVSFGSWLSLGVTSPTVALGTASSQPGGTGVSPGFGCTSSRRRRIRWTYARSAPGRCTS